MDVLFDIRDDEAWAKQLNDEIQQDFPDYFKTNPLIGTEQWWKEIEEELTNGRITFVGERVEDGELINVIDIQPLDDEFAGDEHFLSQPEYSIFREGYWLNEAVQSGKLVQFKSVTICPSGELDENAIYIEIEVRVW